MYIILLNSDYIQWRKVIPASENETGSKMLKELLKN